MQDIVVGAFRKRLSNRGYTQISIKRNRSYPYYHHSDIYIVSAIEPLSNILVSVSLSVSQMYHLFR